MSVIHMRLVCQLTSALANGDRFLKNDIKR